jgi:hypothetical protein
LKLMPLISIFYSNPRPFGRGLLQASLAAQNPGALPLASSMTK